MSQEEEHSILDLMDGPEPPSHNWLNYLSLTLLAIGVLLNYMHIAYDKPVLVIAFLGMLLYGCIHFFRKKRPLYAWFYFAGRLALLASLILILFRIVESKYVLVFATLSFALGVIFSKKKDPNAETDTAEKEEEDMLL